MNSNPKPNLKKSYLAHYMEEASSLVSGWAWLPSNLLDSILGKLIPISDCIRFSAVCRHWKSVALHHKQQHLESYHKQLPMLMVPSSERNNDQMRGLYSVTQGKTYSFELHVPYNKRCCGSSHGWLACVDDNLVITLLNPFTRRTISLPPVMEVPPEFLRCDYYIVKVVLSADPCLFPNDYEVLVIYDHAGKKIAHIKSGDDGWTQIVIPTRIGFCDVIYYQGQFVVVSYEGQVFWINVSCDSTSKPHISKVVEQYSLGTPYLVESSRGDLLLIRKFELFDFLLHRVTMSFKVFKLLCACGDRPEMVEEIESIGNDALFLCETESMCVCALDFPRCQPNSIYFSASDWESQGPVDMASFNLESRRTEAHYYRFGVSLKNMPPSVWILPTMV